MKGFLGSSTGSNVNRIRLVLVGLIFIIIFIVYLTHLFSLQIINTGIYEKKAKDVRQRSEIIPAQRGKIYDRHYDYPLAMNIDSFAIHLTLADIEGITIDELVKKLSDVLLVSENEIRRKIPRDRENQYNSVEIQSGVSFDKVVFIAEHIDEFSGVSWSSKPDRYYSQTGSISHILGYIGSITDLELQVLFNKGYSFNSLVGKRGIEQQYDGYLKGEDGKRIRTVDVKGRGIDKKDIIESPQNGLNLVLTVDKDIQLLAEKALGKRKGAVVVLQPSTGEVLAMVSYPNFDPNKFSLPGPTNFGVLSLDPDFPLINRAIQSRYPPASTFKLILSAALLDTGNIDPEKKIVCTGSMKTGNRVTKCHKKSGHGAMNLKEALGQSCNVYFATAGMENLGIDVISKYAQYFGLSSITEIDLPGEVSGLIPSRAWKEERENNTWKLGDTINVSIGQGYVSSTPLQVANEVAMIVNDGIVYKPHFLKEVIDPVSGEIIETIEPEILRTSPIKKETFIHLKENMRHVVAEATSSTVILNKQVDVAAKTGTGEVGLEENWHTWFASFGPYETDDPDERVVVLTSVEASDEWDWWAAKAADIIYEGIFGKMSYEEVIRDFKRRKVWYALDIELEELGNGNQ